VKYLKTWQRILTTSHGPASAAGLAARIRSRYDLLTVSHAHITSKALRAQLRDLVLPGLALYQTLLEAHENDRESALAESETLIYPVLFKVERMGIPLLRVLPDPFSLLRPALRMMTRNTYLPGAMEVVEDSPACFAINTYRCFILDTLTEAGAPELTTLYCKTDDWLAELLPKVCWLRTGTLAAGADCCDFRWCRA
jgi:hypothetical protein